MNKDERIAELEAANARQTQVSILQSDLLAELRRQNVLLKEAIKLQVKDGTLAPSVLKLLRESLQCDYSLPSVSSSSALRPTPVPSAEQPEPSPPPLPQSSAPLRT